MSFSQIINIAGLSLDMVGVVILFRYGIPPEVNPHGHTFELREQDDEDEKRKWLKFKRRSNIGLCFIFIGFFLQIISTIISNNSIPEPTHCKHETNCTH